MLTGRLWWRREGLWGIEIDGECHQGSAVEITGLKLRTAVSKDGAFNLPSGPLAIVEFEAQAVTIEEGGKRTIFPAPIDAPANDNNSTEQS